MSLKEDLAEVKQEIKELRKDLHAWMVTGSADIATLKSELKVKSGIWGALGAIAVGAAYLLFK